MICVEYSFLSDSTIFHLVVKPPKLPLDKAKYTLGKGNIFICKSKQKNCFYLGEAKYTFGEARFHFNSIEHETKQRKLALGK